MRIRSAQTFTVILLMFSISVAASDWNRFRGPNGDGISGDEKPTPVKWSESENLKWKVELPGPGSSSPIVVGKRVFVTCWSGYGVNGNTSDQKQLKRHLVCIDRETGKTTWKKDIDAYLPEDRYGGMFAENGYASHTPVSDGERVFVFFGKTGVLAFDLDGKQLWQQSVGTESGAKNWGSASSPILYKNMVIVPATAESESMVALDKETGKQVWQAEAGGFSATWGTPVLVEVSKDETDLVIAVPYEVWGFNPDTGKLRWYCDGIQSDSMCSSVVAHDGIVYAVESGPGGGGAIAVRCGGKGDVTETHVLWTTRDRGRIGTPVFYGERIYWVSGGIANCIDAQKGNRVYQSRMTGASSSGGRDAGGGRGGFGGRGGQDYSSPVSADGKLYYTTRAGTTYVIALEEKFQQLAQNSLSDGGDFSATPAISDGELFIRSTKNLYCISPSKK